MKRFSPQDVPNAPGVYLFRNAAGEVIYVGKAKSLRRRLSSYFQPSRSRTADPKLRALIHSIDAYEVRRTKSEGEALLLEDRLVKEFSPRYNVDLRDDKRFLLLAVDPHEPFPRLSLVRVRKPDGRLYFGPTPRAALLRELVRWLAESFRLRTCRGRDIAHSAHSRHCLNDQLGLCCGPCRGTVTPELYAERIAGAVAMLRGVRTAEKEALAAAMRRAAQEHDFEQAAKLRDILQCLRELREVPAGAEPSPMVRPRRAGLPPEMVAEGLAGIQQILGLKTVPHRIECFDNSNIAGCFAVGSMVCFLDGRAAPREYRHFRIRAAEGNDDFAMMHEVLSRRYARPAEGAGQGGVGEEHPPQRVTRHAPIPSPMPDLIVVDGGAGQLRAAREVLAAMGLDAQPAIGLAKRLEEIYRGAGEQPLQLPRHSPALRILQALRDEAHRFALTYNRLLRRQRLTESRLDDIPGIGETRRNQLLREFGSVARLGRATATEIARRVPGVGEPLAQAILSVLRRQPDK